MRKSFDRTLGLIKVLVITLVALSTTASTSAANPLSQLSDQFICEIATDEIGKSRQWTTDPSLQNYVREAIKRSIKCAGLLQRISPNLKQEDKNRIIRDAFVKLSASDRKKIQYTLKHFGYYNSSIDGVFGTRTAQAMITFNNEKNDNLDLSKSSNVNALINKILSFSLPSKRTTPKSNIIPETLPELFNVSSGTGFFISKNGHIVSNFHVIEGCSEIYLQYSGQRIRTALVATDKVNDLALLNAEIQPRYVFGVDPLNVYPLQEIVVAGFPFGERISSSIKFTKGVVSALTGIGNNYSEMQIDAALQPGNSGGPIIDEFGNVIGVAVSKLDMKLILEDYGVIPENTNFGIKATVLRNLLDANRITYLTANKKQISSRKLSKQVTDGTVFLSCWMTRQQIQKMEHNKVMFKEFE
ncbi:serine protease [Planktomarina temperata]|nr:serine protease [Planktomarina temperata]